MPRKDRRDKKKRDGYKQDENKSVAWDRIRKRERPHLAAEYREYGMSGYEELVRHLRPGFDDLAMGFSTHHQPRRA